MTVTTKFLTAKYLQKKVKLYRDIAVFTAPCIIELFLFSLISVVNLAMVGHLGAEALSAVGLSAQPVGISLAVFQAFGIGSTALIARFVGAGDITNARKVIVQTLQISFLLGLLISIPLYGFARSIVIAMGAKAETIEPAVIYIRFMAIGTVFQAIPLSISSLFRGAGDSKTPMKINILANVINLISGYIFIYGIGPVPAMGVYGAGLAATTAKIISTILVIILLFKTSLPIRLDKSIRPGWDIDIIRRIIKIGSASAVEQLIMRIGFFIYTRTIASLGTAAFAAHQVCINISGLSTNLGQALGMASSSFTGRSLGAGKPEKAISYVKELHFIAIILSVIVSAVFIIFGNHIASFYTNDKEVLQELLPVLIILALINPAQNTLLVVSGSLKGAGETRWPLLISLLGLSLIRLPIVFILTGHTELGLKGAWIAAVTEKYTSYILLRLLFHKGKWKNISV